jgi:hypothetical protein
MNKRKIPVTLTTELHEAAYLRARFLFGEGALDRGIVGKYIRQLIRADVAKGTSEGLLLANGTDGELLDAMAGTPGNILQFPTP